MVSNLINLLKYKPCVNQSILFICELHSLVFLYQLLAMRLSLCFYYTGSIQNPKGSIIALVEGDVSIYGRPNGISAIDSKFSIANERSQYLGK